MSELYKLNKDELIQIILAVKERMSIEELKTELKRKEELEKLFQLKRALLNLKVIPHLRKYIYKNEDLIKNAKSIKDMIEKSDLGHFSITNKAPVLDHIIKYGNINNSWINSDKISYCQCEICNNYEILVYKDEKLISVYSAGGCQSNESEFVESTCIECQIN